MATFEKPRSSRSVPADLLPVIRESAILSERLFSDVRAKVLHGEYPSDPVALAERLIKDQILTEYQVRRFLSNKPHGLIVGRYVIQDRIGSGSMGRVYKAHHLMMDRTVALKIIAPELICNDKVVSRFQREMRLVGRLDHPNVIRAFDADQINKLLYIVMEFAQGQSLGQRLGKGPIPPTEMIDQAAQAALGLAHAHEQGIVHRDIKPSNILVTSEGQVKVLDLGLGVLMEADNSTSFATADGIAVGTVDYMSPEQACGREVDGRSDLFSLGCAMYHLMTGKLPYPGDNPIERMGKRISGKPVPIIEVKPDMPSSLVRVMDKLMAHKPSDRFQTGVEAAEALYSLLRPKVKAPKPERVKETLEAPPPALVASPPPEIVKLSPTYPRWFQPLAALAEERPRVALAASIGLLTATFIVGWVVGWLGR